jgi:WD40 repeat protein
MVGFTLFGCTFGSQIGKVTEISLGDQAILSLDIHSSGKTLAASDLTGTIRLLRLYSGVPIGKLEGHNGGVRDVEFLEKTNQLVSGGIDRTLRIWNLDDLSEEAVYEEDLGEIYGIAVPTGEDRVFVCSNDKTIRCWNLRTGQQEWRYGSRMSSYGTVYSLAISPDGSRVYGGCENGTIQILDGESGEHLAEWQGPAYAIMALSISPDGKTLASAGTGKDIRLWDTETGTFVDFAGTNQGTLSDIEFSLDGNRLLAGGFDYSLRLFDTTSKEEIQLWPNDNVAIHSVALAPHGNWAFSGDYSGNVKIWEVFSR